MVAMEILEAEQALINLYNKASLQPRPLAGDDTTLSFAIGSPKSIKVVVQGDSWCDYLPGWDIVKSLKYRHGFAIENFGTGGDTLENMLYGTGYESKPWREWERKPCEHEKVLAAVSTLKPRFFIFSGGGNDVAGPELTSFLNHADAGLGDVIRTDYLNYMVHTVFRKYYEHMVSTVTAAHNGIQILVHGYGHPLVTGKGVVNAPGWHFIGPWLMPALISKGITSPTLQFTTIARIIDTLNDMLADLAVHHPNVVHYIDLRKVIRPRHWLNELHLHPEGFDLVGAEFRKVMVSQMIPDEVNRLEAAKLDLGEFLKSDGGLLLKRLGVE